MKLIVCYHFFVNMSAAEISRLRLGLRLAEQNARLEDVRQINDTVIFCNILKSHYNIYIPNLKLLFYQIQ